MSDLSNLLGAVYGSNDPDGPSTRHEPSAAERAQVPAAPPRIDDDLAAALSAALVTSTPDASVGAPPPMAHAPAQSPAPAFAAAPAPAPVAQPAVVAPAPQPAYTPTYASVSVAWSHGDDDILPMSPGKKR